MKNWRTIVVLALVFLGLGGLATWDEWQTEKDEEGDKTKNKVVTFKAEDVTEIDFASKGVTTDAEAAESGQAADDEPKAESDVRVTVVKKDGAWRLTRPVDSLADTSTVDNLIRTVTDYAASKEITAEREKWADFGLLDPERTLTLRVGGDAPQEFSIFIGNKVPVSYNVYFRTSKDDKVFMGSQHLLVSTAKTLYDFRDKSMVKIDETKLKSLTFERTGHQPVEIVKNDGKYSIAKPEVLEADGGELKAFIDELNLIRVSSFFDQPDVATVKAFETPGFVVTWQGETGETSTLKFVEHDAKLLAAFDPSKRVYGLPEEFKPKLQKDLTTFRNRRILSTEILDVQAVEIDGMTYRVVAGNWYLDADAAKLDDAGKPKDAKDPPKEQSHIRALMVDLEFAKTDRFLAQDDPAAKALVDAPEHRITLRYADKNKQPMVLSLFKLVGEPTGDKYLVQRSGAPYLYRVSKTAFASMTPSVAKPEQPADDAPQPDSEAMPLEEGEPEGLNLEDPSENSGLDQGQGDANAG